MNLQSYYRRLGDALIPCVASRTELKTINQGVSGIKIKEWCTHYTNLKTAKIKTSGSRYKKYIWRNFLGYIF